MALRPLVVRRCLALAGLCVAGLAASAALWPARVLASVGGLACRAQTVCTDDPQRLLEASGLYDEALRFLAVSVAPLDRPPLAVFCSTPSCYALVGQDGSAAKTVGRFVIVISPRGWAAHVVRHELIHRLQAQELGVLGMYGKPEWFIEGMAYALSDDPRAQLVGPYQNDRARFQAWCAAVGKQNLWTAPVPK